MRRARLALALILVAGLVVIVHLSGALAPEPPVAERSTETRDRADPSGPDAAVRTAEVRPERPASRLRVLTRDPGGEPLPDVPVRVIRILLAGAEPVTTVTGDSGVAELELPAGVYRLRAFAPGWRPVEAAVTLRGEDVELGLVLRRATFLAVRVVDEGGRSVSGARVGIASARRSGPGGGDGREARTDEDGLCRVPIDAWWPPLRVAAWGPDLLRSGTLEVGTPPGNELHALVVCPDPSVRIRLRDADSGDPLEGTVDVYLGSEHVLSMEVGAAGRVLGRPGILPPLRAVAHAPDHVDATFSLARSDPVRDVRMTPRDHARGLVVLVRGPDAAPLSGVRVLVAQGVRMDAGTARETVTGGDGSARLALPVAVGRVGGTSFRALLAKPGYASECFGIVVSERDARGVIEVERTLVAAATVTAEVLDDSGKPVVGARVFATQAEGRSAYGRLSPANRLRNPVLADARGEAYFADLRADRAVELLAFEDGGGVAMATLPADRERDARVTLVLSWREPLVVSVTDGERPIAGAAVGCELTPVPAGPGRQALAESRIETTDARGEATVRGLPAGPCRIVVAHPGYHVLRRGLAPGARRAEVVLVARVSISGRVEPFDETIPGARVHAFEANPPSGSSAAIPAVVREDGSFEIEGLRPGVLYRIELAKDAAHHHGDGRARVEAPAEGVVLAVTVRPEETARITLEVRGPEARSGPGEVLLHHLDAKGRLGRVARMVFLRAPEGPEEPGVWRGTVVLPRLVGLLEIVAGPSWPEFRAVDLVGDAEPTIAIRPAPRRTATFRVRDAAGAPVSARISVFGTPRRAVPGPPGSAGGFVWRGQRSASTNAEGDAQVVVPPAGAWFATVRAGGESHRVESSDRPDAEGRHVIRLSRLLPEGR